MFSNLKKKLKLAAEKQNTNRYSIFYYEGSILSLIITRGKSHPRRSLLFPQVRSIMHNPVWSWRNPKCVCADGKNQLPICYIDGEFSIFHQRCWVERGKFSTTRKQTAEWWIYWVFSILFLSNLFWFVFEWYCFVLLFCSLLIRYYDFSSNIYSFEKKSLKHQK